VILPVVILSNRNTPAVGVTALIDVKNRKFDIVVFPFIVFVDAVLPSVIVDVDVSNNVTISVADAVLIVFAFIPPRKLLIPVIRIFDLY
jgi:hypothetical protein